MKKNNFNKESGITLIALIITIIILVILAAVSIRAVYNMGIVGHAINGTQQYAQKAVEENTMLDETTTRLESAVAKVKEIQEDTSEETRAPGGITGFTQLEDGTYKDSNNNEWVWIEVPNDGTGPIYPANATDVQIEEALRSYCSDLIPEGITSGSAGTSTYGTTDTWYDGCGLSESEYETTKSTMLQSIKTNGGFYIGKYETGYEYNDVAGIRSFGTDYNTLHDTNQTAVIKKDAYPYNWVTCSQAESLAKSFAPTRKNNKFIIWNTVGFSIKISKYKRSKNSIRVNIR